MAIPPNPEKIKKKTGIKNIYDSDMGGKDDGNGDNDRARYNNLVRPFLNNIHRT
jgi:hypothetical protein